MIRWLLVVVLVVLAAAGGLFFAAGRAAPPSIEITRPDRVVGQAGTLEVVVGSPGGRLESLTMALEQSGKSYPLFSMDSPQAASISQVDADHLRVSRPFGKQSVPELQSGQARIVVTASRKSFSRCGRCLVPTTRDVQVRLEPPRIAVLSTHHYVNHGGAEMVVYRATPAGCRPQAFVSATWSTLATQRAPRAWLAPMRRRGSRSSRCFTTRISTRRLSPSRATRPATKPRRRSSRRSSKAVPPEPHRYRRPVSAARRPGDSVPFPELGLSADVGRPGADS